MAGQHQYPGDVEGEQGLAGGEQRLSPPDLVQVSAEHRPGDQRGHGIRGDEQPGEPGVTGAGDDEQCQGDGRGVRGQPGHRGRGEQQVTTMADAWPGHTCATDGRVEFMGIYILYTCAAGSRLARRAANGSRHSADGGQGGQALTRPRRARPMRADLPIAPAADRK